jgi:hypothetical protein
MVTKEKLVDWFCTITYCAIIWLCFLVIIVCAVISCVAETRMNIEVIKSGNVPVEVHNEK